MTCRCTSLSAAEFIRGAGLVLATFCAIAVLAGCSDERMIRIYEPILGAWRTQRGIIMVIETGADHEAHASVKLAPGFLGDDVAEGKVVINRIKYFDDLEYTGFFDMPDTPKPVKVRMLLTGRNTLVIMSHDSRVKGRRMVWRRVIATGGERE